MKPLTLILAAILLTSCATWSRGDKAFLAASWLAAGADYYTTHEGLSNGYEDGNPIISNDGTALLTILVSQTAITYLAYQYPKYRKLLLGGSALIHTGCAVHNNNLD